MCGLVVYAEPVTQIVRTAFAADSGVGIVPEKGLLRPSAGEQLSCGLAVAQRLRHVGAEPVNFRRDDGLSGGGFLKRLIRFPAGFGAAVGFRCDGEFVCKSGRLQYHLVDSRADQQCRCLLRRVGFAVLPVQRRTVYLIQIRLGDRRVCVIFPIGHVRASPFFRSSSPSTSASMQSAHSHRSLS